MNCTTGCREPMHMATCTKCGAEYHIGIVHFCPTVLIIKGIAKVIGTETVCYSNPNYKVETK